METNELGVLLDELARMRQEGKEEEAKELLKSRMQELPEEVQDKLLFSMFVDGLKGEMEGLEAVREIQGKGLAIAEALEEQKKSLEK